MPTDVIMPQMGESIFEGTITKWLKKPGDTVQRDEPLFEISTDKVDAEIPSPASGVLTEVKIAEGNTVQINTVVGVIGEANGQVPAAPAPTAAPVAAAAPPSPKSSPAPALAETAAPAPASLTDVIMPQMGESIFEGTITKWLKKPGDTVQQDEPLFEISTDKVDAEIPSPVAGVLSEIKVEAGTTVQINTVVAVIGAGRRSGSARCPAGSGSSSSCGGSSSRARNRRGGNRRAGSFLAVGSPHCPGKQPGPAASSRHRLCRADHQGRYSRLSGQGRRACTAKPAPAPPTPAAPQAAAPAASKAPAAPAASVVTPGDELVPLTRMRAIIAQRMVDSKRTSAHVHTVFKIDMSRIVRIREKEKSKYEQRNGVKLTYMPFISRAVIATLRKMPIVNASMEGDAIRYHKNINLGIAVALDWGLIVPVIRQAEDKSFLGIARAIVDLAERARAKKLKPEEVASGTFTITNPGIFGEQFGTPVINQPESAILGVGGLFKEATVVTDENGSDSLAIRSIIRLTLGFDHRIIDGADAGRFMAEVKKYLENWNEDIG